MKTIVMKFKWLIAVGLILAVLAPSGVQAQSGDPNAHGPGTGVCKTTFLTLPAWYNGLATGANCDIRSPTEVGGVGPFVWIIVLNIIEMVLRLTAYAAVAFIIYGGYKYMISAGSADGMVAARKTIMNACIGLVISVAAVAIVNTLSNSFGL